MRGNTLVVGCLAAVFLIVALRPVLAQQEVYHPGETYDTLQAGQDAYADTEAQRRALIGRQLMLEEQIQQQNTWADPQDKYRPVRPESYGPIFPKAYSGPTLADVYAYPPTDGGPVFYGAHQGTGATDASGRSGSYVAPVPVFQPWPRVPGDIWGTPYYGYVRQPIGHVKIWTGPLSYIYKPIYASPPAENPPAYAAAPRATPLPSVRAPARPEAGVPSPTAELNALPPPPSPMIPRLTPPSPLPGAAPNGNPPRLGPPQGGQEI